MQLLSILVQFLSLVSLVVLSGGDAGLRDGCGSLALVHINFSLAIKDFHLTGLLVTPLFTPALQRRTCLLQVFLRRIGVLDWHLNGFSEEVCLSQHPVL